MTTCVHPISCWLYNSRCIVPQSTSLAYICKFCTKPWWRNVVYTNMGCAVRSFNNKECMAWHKFPKHNSLSVPHSRFYIIHNKVWLDFQWQDKVCGALILNLTWMGHGIVSIMLWWNSCHSGAFFLVAVFFFNFTRKTHTCTLANHILALHITVRLLHPVLQTHG